MIFSGQIRKSITEVAESKGVFAKSFFHHIIGYKALWQKLGYGTPILDKLVFSKMQALVGGRLKVGTTTGKIFLLSRTSLTRSLLPGDSLRIRSAVV